MHANYRSSSLEMWFVGLNDIVHKKKLLSTRTEGAQLSCKAMRYFTPYPKLKDKF